MRSVTLSECYSIIMVEAQKLDSGPTSLDPKTRTHLDFLDGIRAVAALFVVLHHTWQGPFGRVAREGVKGWLTNWVLYGHLAVDVFIVLSGFCLVLPVARSGVIAGGARGFFQRRAHRILPPFYFALALSLPINFAVHKIGHHPLVTAKALAANLFLLQDWLPRYNVLDGPLWSVAAEWKIYFFFPVFVWIWRRFNAAWMLAAAATLGGGLTETFHVLNPEVGMGNTAPWYLFLFAMGITAGASATGWGRNSTGYLKWSILALFAILAILLGMYPITTRGEDVLYGPHLPLIDPVAGALTAALLVFLYQKLLNKESFWLLQALSWKPLAFIGTFSYSIYLVHIPLIGLAAGGIHRVRFLNSPHALEAFSFLVMYPTILALAYGFHLLFERPFLNKRPVS